MREGEKVCPLITSNAGGRNLPTRDRSNYADSYVIVYAPRVLLIKKVMVVFIYCSIKSVHSDTNSASPGSILRGSFHKFANNKKHIVNIQVV